eukprot:11223569-Alexandrium_andersonii.AAC.1
MLGAPREMRLPRRAAPKAQGPRFPPTSSPGQEVGVSYGVWQALADPRARARRPGGSSLELSGTFRS